MLEEFSADAGVRGSSNLPSIDAPLPTGRHALRPDVVAEVQRVRLLESMLRICGESGYGPTTVQDVLERAGTSRRVFYEHYRSKEECFLAAYGAATEQLEARLTEASLPLTGWRERLHAALSSLLAFVDEEPGIARALIIEVHAAGPRALARRMETMGRCARALEAASSGAGNPARSAVSLEGVLGGIEHTVRAHLRAGDAGASTLLPELMHFAVLSLIGPEAAEQELASASLDPA
jgi:AcrR family transcriptional regulator